MAFLAGKGGRISAGGTNMRVTRWSGNVRGAALDVSSTEGNGFEEFIRGLVGGSVEGELVYDLSTTPFARFIINTGGSTVATVLYPDAVTTASNLTGTILVENFNIVNEVRGLVTARFSGQFTGTITQNAL